MKASLVARHITKHTLLILHLLLILPSAGPTLRASSRDVFLCVCVSQQVLLIEAKGGTEPATCWDTFLSAPPGGFAMKRTEPCTSGEGVFGWAGWLSPPRSAGLAPVAVAPSIYVQVLLVQSRRRTQVVTTRLTE